MDHTIPQTSYTVIVRILPNGEEFDMELPASSTGKIIKDTLLSDPGLGISRVNASGQQQIYRLISKNSQEEVTDNKTLYECGVNVGDTLLFKPDLVAG